MQLHAADASQPCVQSRCSGESDTFLVFVYSVERFDRGFYRHAAACFYSCGFRLFGLSSYCCFYFSIILIVFVKFFLLQT